MNKSDLPESLLERIAKGTVIPAMPLALDPERKFDELHQRALIRYYIDAGAGGIAVGVHTTQFEIRDPQHALFKPVLGFCSRVIDEWSERRNARILKVAGICGQTPQAEQEAVFAVESGYDAGLLSLGAMKEAGIDELISHCERISGLIPLVGFYLQPAVGGRLLPYSFWRRFAEIENVLAIKIAPFNRYQTLDVVRAVFDAGRDDISLYTGNDDNILLDLLTEYAFEAKGDIRKIRIRGGLLGQWAVWTRKAVQQLGEINELMDEGSAIPRALLQEATQLTDSNAVIFDAANQFAGCIPGIHTILHRQGLLPGITCLNPDERLSAGQEKEIDRVLRSYPHLNDDEFVRENIDTWLKA